MWLIITTNRGVRLLDTESGEETILGEPKHSFYGVSWDCDHIYIVADFSSPHPKIRVINKCFEDIGTLDMRGHLIKPHQIAVNDGEMWVANSGKNALTSYDLTTGVFSEHILPDTGGNFRSPFGKNHFNSLTFKNGLVYVCAHNGSVPSTIIVLDKCLKEVERFNMGLQTHNIALNGGITFCNSGQGSVECGTKVYCKVDGFVRGLAQTDEEIIFGVSTWAQRHRRLDGVSGAMVGFIKNSSVEMIDIEGCSQIYEIRVMDKFDYGHCIQPFL